MRAPGIKAAWLTLKRSLITIYNDVYDEHLFVFAAGLSYYFVLSLFPLLVTMASLLAYVPIPHLFEGLLSLMARLVPGDGMSLVRSIVSDVVSHKHTHFLTLGLVFTIWTASSGFAAIIDGLDVVYRVRETRSVWKTRPIALGLTLLAGSLILVAVGLTVEGTTLGIWLAGGHSRMQRLHWVSRARPDRAVRNFRTYSWSCWRKDQASARRR